MLFLLMLIVAYRSRSYDGLKTKRFLRLALSHIVVVAFFSIIPICPHPVDFKP